MKTEQTQIKNATLLMYVNGAEALYNLYLSDLALLNAKYGLNEDTYSTSQDAKLKHLFQNLDEDKVTQHLRPYLINGDIQKGKYFYFKYVDTIDYTELGWESHPYFKA